jgi:hypothetical protein
VNAKRGIAVWTMPRFDFVVPRRASTPANLRKGRTLSLTKNFFTSGSWVKPISARDWPAMTRAAIFASDTPVALLTKGTVREARGLTSST